MAIPVLVMLGGQLLRIAAPKVVKQLVKLGGKLVQKAPKGKTPVNVNAGNVSTIIKSARGKKVVPNSGSKGTQLAKPKNTQGVTGGRNTQVAKPNNTSVAKPRANSGSKGTQVAKPKNTSVAKPRANSGSKGTQVAKPKNTSVAKPRANSGSKGGDSRVVGINPKAFRGAATKAQLLGTVLDSKNVTTKPVPASKPSGPSKRPNNRPSPKVAPSGPSTRPNNKPTSGAMTLRTYLNKAIDKRGSTLSKEKAKGKNFKSIAAAKKGKSLYYMKGDTIMAAVYKEDLKK